MRNKTSQFCTALLLSCGLGLTFVPSSASAFFGFNPFNWGNSHDDDYYYRDRYYRDRYWDYGGPWGGYGGPWGGGPWGGGYYGGPWGYNPWYGQGWGWQNQQQNTKKEEPKLPQ